MKRRRWVFLGGCLGGLVLLLVLLFAAGPLLIRLGFEPFCISGDWPNLRLTTCAPQQAEIPAFSPVPRPTFQSEVPIPVIVDDDGSPDGLIALLYFLADPRFEVQAVTVSYGEAHPDHFAPQLAQMLAALGRTDIPVGFGRAAPLAGANAFPDPWRESSDTFWGLEFSAPQTPVDPVPAVGLILNTLSASPEPVLIFISGSQTNLAEVLRQDPEIQTKIREVHAMGGSLFRPGNIASDWPEIPNQVAEWNIWVDPVAAAEVFRAGLPLYLTPLDATDQVGWHQVDADAWSSAVLPEGALAGEVLDWMLTSWSPDGVYIWDLVAAVVAANPQLCSPAALSVEVRTEPGNQQGQLVVGEGTPNVFACLEVQAEEVRQAAEAVLLAAPGE